MTPPHGFKPHFRKSPLTEPWEPLYSKRIEDSVILGLYAHDAHCNSRGMIHGGLISALADNAMGLSCSVHHENVTGLVTITLHVDLLGLARKMTGLNLLQPILAPAKPSTQPKGRFWLMEKLSR